MFVFPFTEEELQISLIKQKGSPLQDAMKLLNIQLRQGQCGPLPRNPLLLFLVFL
jgi:hypothetical protein